ncbi:MULTISPECIES: cell division protein FtsQ/DivIB [Lysinibacillus]|uniref:Cell division protein DivIB n=1 Tax=Lysinibacillus antri TaxID=2498145 RepID=A0A3S0PRV2_9BACI|nr:MULTISPECIES: FtsQ-type POTRA domain-containing protein [Lysinibacillus]RUL55904.1 FtsQ-type POTRA domain-containing protein [Lysinibacillus antri]TSI11507.1 FtsQ-type POTRA domain-containing protein [Lysinibacillus sp. BW-2-10]
MDKVIDIEDRIPTLREKRRRRTNFKFTVLIFLFFITLFLLLYFQSPFSDIKKINISGAELVDNEEYINYSGLQTGDSMWGFREGEVEKSIKEQHWVKDVQVKRKWLTTVEIKVDEWQKVAYISKDNVFYPMLENGDVFKEPSTMEPIDAPLFLQFEDEKLRKRLLKELAKLDTTVLALISQINATPSSADPYSITLYMNDGYEVRAEITTLAKKLNYYPSIVAQIENTGDFEKGIIDIEVGSYYRSYNDEYTQLNLNFEEVEAESEGQEVLVDEEETITQ